VLCKIANAIRPGVIPKINNRSLPFFYLENIGSFLNSLAEFGIARNDMFLATDVVEDKNNSTVRGFGSGCLFVCLVCLFACFFLFVWFVCLFVCLFV
jgi:hypothetical protein